MVTSGCRQESDAISAQALPQYLQDQDVALGDRQLLKGREVPTEANGRLLNARQDQ